MFVIWKRPDGFHGAEPSDFIVVNIGHAKLWLHREDRDQFPFRISGGWAEDAGRRLNNLVNLLQDSSDKLTEYVVGVYHDSMKDKPEEFYEDTMRWLAELRDNLKGDKWEVEIMEQALLQVETNMSTIRDDFLTRAKK